MNVFRRKYRLWRSGGGKSSSDTEALLVRVKYTSRMKIHMCFVADETDDAGGEEDEGAGQREGEPPVAVTPLTPGIPATSPAPADTSMDSVHSEPRLGRSISSNGDARTGSADLGRL